MKNNKVNGMTMSLLTNSAMLSYGFTDYDHRAQLIAEIKAVMEKYPSSSSTASSVVQNNPKQNVQTKSTPHNAAAKKQDEQKAVSKVDADESALLENGGLVESEWREWTVDQVWEWIKIKQKWNGDLDYQMRHKVNGYEEKMKSDAVNLTGAKLAEVQEDIKKQTLLKGIGLTFSLRKQVYKHVDALIRHNS